MLSLGLGVWTLPLFICVVVTFRKFSNLCTNCPVLNIFEVNVSLKLYSLVRKLIFSPALRSSIFRADSEYIKNVKFWVVGQKL